ncbi:MAG: LON peptidase substrate-binding domain-containing protein [Chloroflexaceae bacterium]|jgi:ATP-dependent Lon protease|nr:LON peptidase substrate-binding domain-containing protein [Chloroflexaceae bacterium]
MISVPNELDILPLFGTVIYPQTVVPLAVSQPATLRLLEGAAPAVAVAGGGHMLAVVALRAEQRRPEQPEAADCYHVGTVALVHRLLRLPDGTLRLAVEGLQRCMIESFMQGAVGLRGHVRLLPEASATAIDEALLAQVQTQGRELLGLIPTVNQELAQEIEEESDPQRLVYMLGLALLARRRLAERQQLLELPDLPAQLAYLSGLLDEEIRFFQRKTQ